MRILQLTAVILVTYAVAQTAAGWRGSGGMPNQASASAAVSGDINPLSYPGGDLGEQINNVFAGGDHCANIAIPSGNYVYATTIHLFLPCQSIHGAGSGATTLEYAGKGDAILWQMLPYTIRKAGTVKGFLLKGPGTSAGNGIHSGSLIGATFEDLVINNFRGPHSAGILLENLKITAAANGGKAFQAWTERTVMRDVHIGIPHLGNTTALAFVANGGTNSFGYTDISDVWLNVEEGQVGVNCGAGTYIYNSKLVFHANISGSGSNAFLIGGTIRNSELFLSGEAHCAKDLVHVLAGGDVQAQGMVAVNCPTQLTTQGQYVRTDLAGVQVDNPRWDSFQLSPFYAPLINNKGLLITHDLGRSGETDLTNYYGASADGSVKAGGFTFYNTHSNVQAPNSDPKDLLAKLTAGGNWMASGSAAWGGGAAIPSSDQVVLKSQLVPLTSQSSLAGTTASIGGKVNAGSCLSGVAKVSGARVGQVVPHPNATDGSLDSAQESVSGAVTASNVVTVQRCVLATVTLSPKSYSVRVLP